MRIRRRMALVAVAVALPQLVGILAWDTLSRHHAAEDALAGMASWATSRTGAEQACLADPTSWTDAFQPPGAPHPRRPPPPPHRRGGPHVDPPTLSLGTGSLPSWPSRLWSGKVAVEVQTGWPAPCDVVVVRGSTAPGFMGSVLPRSPVWIAPALLLATVMWLAVGPPVRRLRRLQAQVEADETLAIDGDDEIAELARAFTHAKAALADEMATRTAQEAALREFVANTAHDVRIPLTVLQGHLVALEQAPDPHTLELAMREAHYLGALLDDLAAHARMEHTAKTPRSHSSPWWTA